MRQSPLNSIAERIRSADASKGFWAAKRALPELIAGCHARLSDARERNAARGGGNEEAEAELAECLILVIRAMDSLGTDIDAALEDRLGRIEGSTR